MELAFQTNPLRYLHCTVQEVRSQEETAETIVPDSFPDIASIVDCCAVPILRGKDCRSGSVTVSGGVKGAILYTPEDRSYTRRLEVYLPFTMKFEDRALAEDAQVICSIRVCDLDARAVNSRKAMLRVELACELTAYEQTEQLLYTLQPGYPDIQTRTATYQMSLPLEIAEKSFVISDTLDISNGHPPISQIYKIGCYPELTDQKLVGNKAVFKGILHCKFLYISENQELYLYQQQLPFSQYCEMGIDYDQETVCVYPVVTGYDVEAENGDRVQLTVNILAQALATGVKPISLAEDAYSTKGGFTPQWKQYDFDNCLDRQISVQSVRQHLRGELKEILDWDVYWNYPVCNRENDQMQVSVPVRLRVLGRDAAGQLQTLRTTAEAMQTFALSGKAGCRADATPVGDVHTSISSDGADVHCEVSVCTTCYANRKFQTLCGGEFEEQKNTERRPSVILRSVPKDTSIWDLAKTYGSTESAIREANRLDSESIEADSMLLLPIG